MNLATKYRPYGVKVTDLSSQMWCEKQLEFSFTKPRIRTAEMKKGEQIHSEKEEEIYEIITVTPKTWDDRILLNLHNDLTALEGLLETGVARELFLWGRFGSLKMVGIADELRTEDGRLVISDTKTRKSPTMPRVAQSRPTKFQLMAYQKLFEDIRSGKYVAKDLLRHYFKKVDAHASTEFVSQHKELGLEFEPSMLKAAEKAFSMFGKVSDVSGLEVSYEYQETKEPIGKYDFSFDEKEFSDNISFCEEFWNGKRESMGVSEYNSWKCSYCQYKEECETCKGFLSKEGLD